MANAMETAVFSLPVLGWEQEAAGPVEPKTPTAASPAPGQTLLRNPQETFPVRRGRESSSTGGGAEVCAAEARYSLCRTFL